MYFVYIIKNIENGALYIGYTNNLARRLKEHQKSFPQNKVIYYEAYLMGKDARSREIKLKYYGSAWRALKKRISA